MEQAGGSEEKEDDLGRMLQDQAEYRDQRLGFSSPELASGYNIAR